MQLKDINQAIGDLINRGGAEGALSVLVTPGFHTTNIYPTFKHCFNDKANKALNNNTPSLLHQYNHVVLTPGLGNILCKLGLKSCKISGDGGLYVRKVDVVRFIATRATKDKLKVAVEKVIDTVNDLANKGFMKASLAPFIAIALPPVTSPEMEFIIASYITLTDDGYKYLMASSPNMSVNEGELPSKVE